MVVLDGATTRPGDLEGVLLSAYTVGGTLQFHRGLHPTRDVTGEELAWVHARNRDQRLVPHARGEVDVGLVHRLDGANLRLPAATIYFLVPGFRPDLPLKALIPPSQPGRVPVADIRVSLEHMLGDRVELHRGLSERSQRAKIAVHPEGVERARSLFWRLLPDSGWLRVWYCKTGVVVLRIVRKTNGRAVLPSRFGLTTETVPRLLHD